MKLKFIKQIGQQMKFSNKNTIIYYVNNEDCFFVDHPINDYLIISNFPIIGNSAITRINIL